MPASIDATNSSQAQLIEALGGPEAVAEIIGDLCRAKVPPKHVMMMRNRGIPWHYRPALARVANKRGIALPPGFLGYEVAA